MFDERALVLFLQVHNTWKETGAFSTSIYIMYNDGF